jgi:cytochrome b561
MSSHGVTDDSRAVAGVRRVGYDWLEMTLHWATALLVVTNYALSQLWSLFPHGTPLRNGIQGTHVSLGVLLAAVIVIRVLWRLGPGRRVGPAGTGLMELAAQAAHYSLYALLIAVTALGFCFRWAQLTPLTFFGLFAIPSPYPFTKDQLAGIGDLHSWAGTIIIVLAALHAGRHCSTTMFCATACCCACCPAAAHGLPTRAPPMRGPPVRGPVRARRPGADASPARRMAAASGRDGRHPRGGQLDQPAPAPR